MRITETKNQRVFFTSDTHFNHGNIIKYALRRFCLNEYEAAVFKTEDVETINALPIAEESIRKHDETLIANWNAKVGANDIVFHLGDFALGGNLGYVCRILRRLNGTIHYIEGNHDKLISRIWYDELDNNKLETYKNFDEIQVNGQSIVLCHYALRVWNGSHKGAWHLYGHSHGTLPDDPHSKSFDVGVDCHNYTPLSFSEVGQIMSKKTFKPIDQHDKR